MSAARLLAARTGQLRVARYNPLRLHVRMLATIACLSMFPAHPACAQRPAPSVAQLAALQKLDKWVGEWSGTGWSVNQTGQRTEFTRTESVSRRVGGTVLYVEGHSAMKDKTAAATAPPSLALVYFDERTQHYRWNGHDFAAGTVETDITLVDGGFHWDIKPDNGATVVRFTILFDDTTWRETGAVTTDGTHWNTFMEMSLTRSR